MRAWVAGRNTAQENLFPFSREQVAYIHLDKNPGRSGEGYRSRDNIRARNNRAVVIKPFTLVTRREHQCSDVWVDICIRWYNVADK